MTLTATGVPTMERAAPDPLAQLARAASRGDPSATSTLCVELGPMVLATLRRILGHAHPELQDLLHESLMGAIDGLARFDERCTVRHYFRRIAVHGALRQIRNRRSDLSKVELFGREWDVHGPSSKPSAPDQAAVLAERRALLRELLARLPSAQAEVLVLQTVFGHSVEEIATLLEIPPNTVRGRLVSAKSTLRNHVRAERRFAELAEINDDE